jgi:glutathione S-transferase
VLNDHLATRDWVAGGTARPSPISPAVPISITPSPSALTRADWPHIDTWLDRIAALPGWKHPYDLMQRAFPPAAA